MSQSNSRDAINEIRNTLGGMGAQFKAVLPSQQHVDRFIRVVMTAVQQNVDLLTADRMSFYAACMRCAQDGLMPDGREAALVIYADKVSYQPMVEGMFKKLRNSGEIVGAPKVHVWKEHDEFRYVLGDEEKIIHVPKIGDRGKTMGAYSIVKLKSGDTSREVMSFDDIMKIKSRSRQQNGPWKTDEDEMCRKTVFRRHYKRLPKSSDLDNVLAVDDEGFVPYDNATGGGSAPAAAQQAAGGVKALEHIKSTVVPSQPVQQQEKVAAGTKVEEKKDGASADDNLVI